MRQSRVVGSVLMLISEAVPAIIPPVNPRVTLVRLFVFCFGAGLMVMFPPVIQRFIWQDVPMVLHDYDFLPAAGFSGGHEKYGLTVEIDWLRLAAQLVALGIVVALVRRPKRKQKTTAMP